MKAAQKEAEFDAAVSKLSEAEWQMIEIMVAVKANLSPKRKELERARAKQRAEKRRTYMRDYMREYHAGIRRKK